MEKEYLDDKINFEAFFPFSKKDTTLNINLEEFLILFFGLSDNLTIKGKTRFQKLIYLLHKEFNVFPNLKYERHIYGPYSEKLEAAFFNLLNMELVEEDVRYFNDFAYQINRKLSNKGLKLFKKLKNKESQQTIERVEKMIKHLKERKYFQMELKDLLEIVYKKAGYI